MKLINMMLSFFSTNRIKLFIITTCYAAIIVGITGFELHFPGFFTPPNLEKPGTQAWLDREMQLIRSHDGTINTHLLRLSLIAYLNVEKMGLSHKQLLTVIDYSKPSSEKRLWVFDLKNGKTLFYTWVSHGKNSGGLNASSFSNSSGSLKSSFGVFVTDDEPYTGHNGYSLRLRGLEAGVNDNAYRRAVVVHGSWYVNSDIIQRYGQIGRSWGCPAVSSEIAPSLINTIKDDTVVFAYYPDHGWLSHSKFLN
ncbi:MAG TPA: murein L,D-transpeptidase catalytic domain family protein [Gammaproteobacteria bacterium]|jgi:hypothetical protein|nr:murein L,D-transpeptidase catalytic domain family protein [Gammaproteobacteria bacterium]